MGVAAAAAAVAAAVLAVAVVAVGGSMNVDDEIRAECGRRNCRGCFRFPSPAAKAERAMCDGCPRSSRDRDSVGHARNDNLNQLHPYRERLSVVKVCMVGMSFGGWFGSHISYVCPYNNSPPPLTPANIKTALQDGPPSTCQFYTPHRVTHHLQQPPSRRPLKTPTRSSKSVSAGISWPWPVQLYLSGCCKRNQ